MTKGLQRQLHAYFTELAELLNENRLYVGKFLTGVDTGTQVHWNGLLVKELIWRTSMEAILKKSSTSKLDDDSAAALFAAIAERIKQLHNIDFFERVNQ